MDGYRALVIKNAGLRQLRSRNDNHFTLRYASIAPCSESELYAQQTLSKKWRMFTVRVTMAVVLTLTLQCRAETVTDSRPVRALYDASNAAMHDGSRAGWKAGGSTNQ